MIQTLLASSHLNKEGNEVVYVLVDTVLYAGFGLAIVLTLILVNKPVWKQVFAILTILAFTPLISFYTHTLSFGIGIISIELTALAILILHFTLNPDVFSAFKSFIETNEETEESQSNKFEVSVRHFESRFQNKSTPELENIATDNSLVPAAVEAAKRILERN
ncbi:MAG: hypothetical protein COA58_15890 [Bacteroidetes bacterium]|nr:MAG: hypothetical protein COA58_15890 [Bacteroidota bacterium]